MMTLNHIGFLSKNCKETTRQFDEMLGTLSWEYFDFFFPQDTVFIGNQFRIRTAVASFGPMDFEILEPYDGEGSYLQETLSECGPGLHHMAYFFDSIQEMNEKVSTLESQGYRRLHDTERLPGHPTIYLQAPDLTMIYELHV